MNNTLKILYANIPPFRLLICILLVVMAILCLVSIFRSDNTIQVLKEERADFADEFLIMFKINRIILFIVFVILTLYLATNI